MLKNNFQNPWFQTENTYDYLEIRDGGITSTVLNKFSGTTFSPEVISTGNQLYLKFDSDSGTQKKGFALTFMEGANVFFYVTPILREINFRDFRGPKDAILKHLGVNFCISWRLKFTQIKNTEPL